MTTTATHTNGHSKQRSTTVLVKPASKTVMPEEVSINAIETLTIQLKIFGKSQLIVNDFGPKCIQQMEDERSLTVEEKKARKKEGKPAITDEEINRRFQNARVLDANGSDCIRSQWLKGALITAAKWPDIGIPSTQLRGALYVEGELLPIVFKPRPKSESTESITYFGKGPGMRRDPVRVGRYGAKQPDLRYRPAYDDWSISFAVTFEPKIISLGGVHQLIRRAGTSVGLCEWRPEGPGGGKGGQYGRFDMKASV